MDIKALIFFAIFAPFAPLRRSFILHGEVGVGDAAGGSQSGGEPGPP